MTELSFPRGFIWGAADLRLPDRGRRPEDGRGESIWDRFATRPARSPTATPATSPATTIIAAPRDIEIMKRLGLGAYRFSIAWPRIFPTGAGRSTRPASTSTIAWSTGCSKPASSPGSRSTTGICRSRSRTPAAGRTATPSSASSTTRRRHRCARRPRAALVITHNEPWCVSVLGYAEGLHAPGATRLAGRAGRRAQSAALARPRGAVNPRATSTTPSVGIVLNLVARRAGLAEAADRDACRRLRRHLQPLVPRSAERPRLSRGHDRGVRRRFAPDVAPAIST